MHIYLSTLFLSLSIQNGYKVQGTIDTAHNGQYIYLYGIDYARVNPKINDSCLITNGQFHFEGKIVTPGLLVSLYTKTKEHSIYQFMLENREIALTVKPARGKNVLGDCVVINNPLTHQYKAWKSVSDPFARNIYFAHVAIDSLKRATASLTLIEEEESRLAILRKQEQEVEKQYVRTHPGEYISLYWLRYSLFNSLAKQKDTLLQLYNLLAPALKQTEEGKLLQKELAVLNAIAPGLPAPDFKAPDESGKLLHLADFRGKYLLLDFWASWCAPCVAAIPDMQRTYALYKDKQLEILGVSLDDKSKAWKDAIAKYKLPWPNISELKGWKGEISKSYNISSIPQNVLIGKDGKILGVDIDPVKDLPNLIK